MNDVPPQVLKAFGMNTEQEPQQPPDAVLKAFNMSAPEQQTQPDIPPAVLQAFNAPPAAPQESLLKRSARRAGQEILATPGTFGALYGLAAAAVDRYANGVPWDEAMLSEEGRDIVDAAQDPQHPAHSMAVTQLQDDPTSILRRGLRSAAEIYNWGGEVTGVTNNPDGSVPLDEEVGGIIGSTLLTLPAAIVTKPLSLANRVSSTALRRGLKGAIYAAELTTPGTIGAGKYGSNIAANAIVQTALSDVARALGDEQTLAGTALDAAGLTEAEADEMVAGQPLSSNTEIAATAGGAAALAAAVGGGRALAKNATKRANIAAQNIPNVDPYTDDLLGRMPIRDTSMNAVRDGLQDFQSFAFDKSNTLLQAMERVNLSQESVEGFESFMNANAGSATNVARDRFMTTGILSPDGAIRTKAAPMEVFRAYDQMPEQLQGRFDLYVEALDELARRARGVRNLPNVTDAELTRRVSANNIPEVRALAEAYFDIGNKMSDYRLKTHTISAAQHSRESGTYMPNIEAEPERTGVAGLFDKYIRGNTDIAATDISRFERAAAGGIEEKVPPMEAMRRYVDAQIREIGQNQVRRMFLGQLDNQVVTDFAQGRTLVTSRNIKDKAGKKITRGIPVEVKVGGRTKTYMVGDPRIAAALQFNPHAVAEFGLNTTRKWFQQATTGVLNPMFAPVSLAYDAFAGMLGGRSGRVVSGLIDARLARAGLSEGARDALAVLRPLDTMMVVGEGLVRGATGQYKRIVAERMFRRAKANGIPIDQAAADAAATTFAESRFGAMQMSGYTANMMTEGMHQLDELPTTKLMRNVTNGVRRNLGAQVFLAGQDVIREAYRMGLFARNYSYQVHVNKANGDPPKPTKKQLNAIVNHVREVGVDSTRRGANDNINRITSAMPYGNITIQSANHLVRNMMMNPGGRMAAFSMFTMAWALREAMSDEALEYHDKRTPDYRRNTSLTFEYGREDGDTFDPNKHLYHLPLGPEMGLLTNSVADGLRSWMGTIETGDPTFGARMRSALFDMMLPGIPPLMQGSTAALTGGGTLNPESAARGDGLIRQPSMESAVPEYRGIGQNDGWVTDRVASMVNSMFGAVGRTIMDSAEVLDMEAAQPDPSYGAAAMRASDVFWYNTVEKQRAGTLFTDAVIETPRGTPLSNKAYEIQKLGETAVQFARDMIPNFSQGPRDKDIPYADGITVLPETLRGTGLEQEAMLIKTFFTTRPEITKSLQDAGQLRGSYFRTRSNTRVNLDERNTQLQKINDEMHQKFETIASAYGVFEDQMRSKFGPTWTLEGFNRRARDAVYNKR